MPTLLKRCVPESLAHSTPAAWLVNKFYDIANPGLERVIFTATTGRSGTYTLAELFKAVPAAKFYHEPYPVLNGEWLYKASHGQQAEVDDYYRKMKSVYIRRGAVGAKYYLEANHLFLKTFIGPAIEDFKDRLVIVHLVRPAIEVAMSIYRIRNWPGTADGNKWWLDYRAPENIIQIADVLDANPEFSHPFYKALWYWYETEARVAFWKNKAPRVKFCQFETAWFNDVNKVVALMNDLGVAYDYPALLGKVGTRENDIQKKKGQEGLSWEIAQEMTARFEALLQDKKCFEP